MGGTDYLGFELTCDQPVVPRIVLKSILDLLVVSGDNLESDTISEHFKRAVIDLSQNTYAHLSLLSKKVSLRTFASLQVKKVTKMERFPNIKRYGSHFYEWRML